MDDPTRLAAVADLADDEPFRERFAAVRRVNKVALTRVIAEGLGFGLDPDARAKLQELAAYDPPGIRKEWEP